MKVELVIEQLIAGLLFLIAVAVPIFGWDATSSVVETVGEASAVAIVAYAFGVVVDRLADSVLDRQAAYLRLEHVAKMKEPAAGTDPFPEDRWRAKALAGAEGVRDWIGYLDTRARIARSLTVMVPFLAVSFAYDYLSGLVVSLDPDADPAWAPWVALLPAFALPCLHFWREHSKRRAKPPASQDPPRTDELEALGLAGRQLLKDWLARHRKWGLADPYLLWVAINLACLALLAVAYLKAPGLQGELLPPLVLVAALYGIVTPACFSAWARITKTRHQFLTTFASPQ